MELLIEMLQPSQLYINRDKLNFILQQIEYSGINSLDKIPIKELDSELIMTDGHTRALALYLLGETHLSVEWEDQEMDWELYRVCVYWAKENHIYSAIDLENRIITDSDYHKLWIERCHNLEAELAQRKDQ